MKEFKLNENERAKYLNGIRIVLKRNKRKTQRKMQNGLKFA